MKPDKHKKKASAKYRKKDEIPSNRAKAKIEKEKAEKELNGFISILLCL